MGQRSSRIQARISALDALTYLHSSVINNVALEATSSNSQRIAAIVLDCFFSCSALFPELLFLFSASMFWELLLWFGVDVCDPLLCMLTLALSMCKCFMLTTQVCVCVRGLSCVSRIVCLHVLSIESQPKRGSFRTYCQMRTKTWVPCSPFQYFIFRAIGARPPPPPPPALACLPQTWG